MRYLAEGAFSHQINDVVVLHERFYAVQLQPNLVSNPHYWNLLLVPCSLQGSQAVSTTNYTDHRAEHFRQDGSAHIELSRLISVSSPHIARVCFACASGVRHPIDATKLGQTVSTSLKKSMRSTESRELPKALQLPKAGTSPLFVCHLHGEWRAVRQACACSPMG